MGVGRHHAFSLEDPTAILVWWTSIVWQLTSLEIVLHQLHNNKTEFGWSGGPTHYVVIPIFF